MHPLAVTLVLISAAIHAWREMMMKKSHDKQIFIWLICTTAVVIFFPMFVYEVWQGHLTQTAVVLSMGGAITHSIYWYFMSRSYEKGDLSHVYPIMRSAPALVFIIAVLFLHERVTTLATLGVVTIVAGIYAINMKSVTFRGFLEPLQSFGERSTRFALLTMLMVTAYSIQDKIMMQHVSPLLYSYFTVVFPTLYWTPFVLKTKSKAAITAEWNKSPFDIILTAIIAMVSYSLILYALTFERVSYVSGLRQIGIVFGVLLGGHLLKERHKWIRLTGSGLIFAGTILIATAP
ncbi:MAG: EamA family transporter [Candidatus Peribacteraceae bacterium]|nr:EamA family transporter [Candidatus Peribacteraceae bacterium]